MEGTTESESQKQLQMSSSTFGLPSAMRGGSRGGEGRSRADCNGNCNGNTLSLYADDTNRSVRHTGARERERQRERGGGGGVREREVGEQWSATANRRRQPHNAMQRQPASQLRRRLRRQLLLLCYFYATLAKHEK